MPARECQKTDGGRRRWRLRTLLLAAVLAGSAMLVTAGAASADFWPHSVDGDQAAAQG